MIMMKRKYIWTTAIVLVILITVVCTLPFPQKIKTSAQGARFGNGGTQLEDVVITIEGFRLNYLFREDKLDVSVTVSNADTDIETLGTVLPAPDEMYFSTVTWFDSTENAIRFGTLAFNRDLSDLFVTGVGNATYAASTDSGADLAAIFGRYAPLFSEKQG